MKKLKLQADELKVESFSTHEVDARIGTVEGHEMVPTPPHVTCQLLTKPTDCPCTPMF